MTADPMADDQGHGIRLRVPDAFLSRDLEYLAQCILTRFQHEPGAVAHPAAAGECVNADGQVVLQHLLWGSERFRYLTLEKCTLGDDTYALSVVLAPDPGHPAPIFGLQAVSRGGRLVWTMVDLSPIASDGSLPEDYEQALVEQPAPEFRKAPPPPVWASTILSRHCVAVFPQDDAEGARFTQHALRQYDLHLALAPNLRPGTQAEVSVAWDRYRNAILTNERRVKILAILQRHFTPEWVRQYSANSLLPPLV